MELTDAQKQALKQWAAQGQGLSELQKRLSEEFGVAMTYMDLRLLSLDMGLQIKDRPGKSVLAKAIPSAARETAAADIDEGLPEGGGDGLSSVSVEVDRIMKPGSVVSGTVKFSDGVSATWMLDQMGRLGLSASKPGYKPRPEDVHAFQEELRRALERQGF